LLFYVRRFIGRIGQIGRKTRKSALSSVFLYRQNDIVIGRIIKTLAEKRGYLGAIARIGSFLLDFFVKFYGGVFGCVA
jgi:hypothetical protein